MGKKIRYSENIILIDFKEKEKWDFLDAVIETTNKEWKVLSEVSNKRRKNGFDNFIRYIKYFLFPFQIFLHRKKIKNIISWQQFHGLLYAFYSQIFHVKKINSLTIMTFIYKDKKGMIGKLYFKFINYILHSKYIDRLICFSKEECEYYSELFSIKREIFQFFPLGFDEIQTDNLGKMDENNKFILSVGRSNRDYDFLIEAMKDEKYPLKIICDELENKRYSDNIEIYNNIFKEKFFDMLNRCYCVVVPLKDENISSGQLVLIQSMQLKKPIIVTKSNTITDYITNGYNGFIIQKEKEELLETIDKLYTDQELYHKIASNGYQEYLDKFSTRNLGMNVGRYIKERILI